MDLAQPALQTLTLAGSYRCRHRISKGFCKGISAKIFSYVNAAGHAGIDKVPLVAFKREFQKNGQELNKCWLISKEK